MSVFDLFRGFLGFSGGQYRGKRDPFFEAMTHDDDEDEDGFYYGGFRGEQQDPFDSAWRFGLSLGPDGMKIQEPPVFGQLLKEMEEMFSQMGRLHSNPEIFGVPRIMPPPPSDHRGSEGRGASVNPLRDFMLKSPDNTQPKQPALPREDQGPYDESFRGWKPFSKFNGILRSRDPEVESKQDGDLDSAVSARGLDQILAPPADHTPQQPRTSSFFRSVIVTKVVQPDGTVEERRTVRDGQGNEETTVTRSEPNSGLNTKEPTSDSPRLFSDMRDDSLFSKFFGGFK